MRKLLGLIAIAVAGAGSSAMAADLPVKAAPAPVQEAVTTWTGFYLGGNVGYGWANVGATGGASSDLNGIIGGGQLGYNWQTGPLVFGIEGDFQGADESRSDSTIIGATTFTVDQNIQWFATARGRIGYAWGPAMLYFTGGGSWQNYKLSVSALGTTVDDNATKFGWTIGGGGEWMFAPHWSAKLEYLYMDTGDTDVTLFGTTFSARAKNNIVRVGLNYHF